MPFSKVTLESRKCNISNSKYDVCNSQEQIGFILNPRTLSIERNKENCLDLKSSCGRGIFLLSLPSHHLFIDSGLDSLIPV
jgi:hypothetical protein